jgi:hypothetical protein
LSTEGLALREALEFFLKVRGDTEAQMTETLGPEVKKSTMDLKTQDHKLKGLENRRTKDN